MALPPGQNPPQTVNMRVLRDAHMPAHALLVIDSSLDPSNPTVQRVHEPPEALVIPVDAETFAQKFTYDISQLVNELAQPGTAFPVPFWDHAVRAQAVTLPLIPLRVPHPASVPLLLLFGLGLHHNISQSQAAAGEAAADGGARTRTGARRRRGSAANSISRGGAETACSHAGGVRRERAHVFAAS